MKINGKNISEWGHFVEPPSPQTMIAVDRACTKWLLEHDPAYRVLHRFYDRGLKSSLAARAEREAGE